MVQKQLKALIKKGLTQSVIAKRARVAQSTVSKILAGVHGDPRSSTSNKIATLYRRVYGKP